MMGDFSAGGGGGGRQLPRVKKYPSRTEEERYIPGTNGMLLMMLQNTRNIYLHCSSLQCGQLGVLQLTHMVCLNVVNHSGRGPCIPFNALPAGYYITRAGILFRDEIYLQVRPVRGGLLTMYILYTPATWRGEIIHEREREGGRRELVLAFAIFARTCPYVRRLYKVLRYLEESSVASDF
jgi:hypothetical protein